MTRFLLGAVLVTFSACVTTIPPPPPPPTQTVAFDLIACAAPEIDGWCPGIAGAVGRLDKVPGAFRFNDDGFVWLSHVPKDLGTTELVIDAPGYEHFDSGPFPLARLTETNAGGAHNSFFPRALPPAHVDPATVPLSKILAFRGSLFTVVANCNLPMFLPSGQRVPVVPFAPLWASPEQRQCSYDLWKARGYTHGVKGPGIDPGYHNQTPATDFRADGGAAFMAQLETEWDQGFVPITVVVPDHLGPEQGWAEHIWTVVELQALEPIYRSPRFQRLARVVMLCWECQGSQYGWSNRTYLEYGAWFKDVFPNSIRILHTIADIEAPVGDGDETNTANCHGLGPDRCLSVADAWTRVGQFFHVWFEQSSALFKPDHVADNGKTDSENWLNLLWNKDNPGSLVRRFGPGGVWSASGILPIEAESMSYVVWWQGRTEAEARAWGDKAMDAGAPGAMDGCLRCGR